jgi:HAE1 family hydrophobic/amphiphilic exporter-1
MITATVLAVFFVPVFYVAIQSLIELKNGPPSPPPGFHAPGEATQFEMTCGNGTNGEAHAAAHAHGVPHESSNGDENGKPEDNGKPEGGHPVPEKEPVVAKEAAPETK